MNKICLIRQDAGLGDIFFCQKIGYHYQKMGYKIIWPVKKVFNYISEYMTNFSYPCVDDEFPYKDLYLNMNNKEIIETDDMIMIPLNGHNLRSSSVMYSKYILVGLPYYDWNKFFNFTRNIEQENRLFYDILELKDGEEYTLYNTAFASPPEIQYKDIPTDNITDKLVKMELFEGITLFDWCKVIENATNILTVDTAINYIIDKLSINTNNLQLYSRYTPANYGQIKGIFKTKWKYNI